MFYLFERKLNRIQKEMFFTINIKLQKRWKRRKKFQKEWKRRRKKTVRRERGRKQ